MSTSRQKILDYLKHKEMVTADQISQALHMTPANARYHLADLVAEGAVKMAGIRLPGGRGRPKHLYRLAEPAMRHNLDRLADLLLSMVSDEKDPAQKEAALQKIASSLAGELPANKNPVLRLNQAIQRLNDLNYCAHWEAHTPAPKVVFNHCPYAAILPQHPEICQMDVLLLEKMLSSHISQTAKLIPSASGLPQCIFTLRK